MSDDSPSSKLAALSPGDRAEVRALAAAILEAVRADESIPLAAGVGRDWARNYPGSALVYHADDVEGLLTRMAQEMEQSEALRGLAADVPDWLAESAEKTRQIADLKKQLAAVSAARDEACEIAAGFAQHADGYYANEHYAKIERIAELRKAGA